MEQVAKVKQVTARLNTTLTVKKKKNAIKYHMVPKCCKILTVYELHLHYNIKAIQCLSMNPLNGRKGNSIVPFFSV